MTNMQSFGLLPVITIPTRIAERSATLLDNFFISCSSDEYLTRAIYDDISDHLPILLDINCSNLKTNLRHYQPAKKYIFNEDRYKRFQQELNNEAWPFLSQNNINLLSPNEAYNLFYSNFKIYFDRAFLTSNLNTNKNCQTKNSQPWMSNNLIKSCRKKSRLLKIYKKTGTITARKNYILYKNILKQALRQEEKLYYQNQFMIKSNDIRSTWKLINSLLNKSHADSRSKIFNIDNVYTEDKNTIVNAFNKYFTELGPNLAKNIPPAKSSLLTNATRQVRDSIVITPTDSIEIKNIISDMKLTSSCGVDHIPVSVLKSIKTKISPILAILINHSIANSSFPDALKIAKVTPILKQGDKSSISNYRPISLLNTFSKIYEKVFLIRLNNFLTKHSILYENQFGLKKKSFNFTSSYIIRRYCYRIT